jgi:pimeloyl-ACP methyl ester carboxylesterase
MISTTEAMGQSVQQLAASVERRRPAAYYRTLVRSGYAPMNGYEMYYEIHGTARARTLVTIHPAWGTANVFPSLIRNRQLIAVELQGHGRSTDSDRPLTFEEEADDIAALFRYLEIEQADFFGESSGGVVAMMMAVRYPGLAGRVATYGTGFGSLGGGTKRPADAYPFHFPREGYERVALDPAHWPVLFDKVQSIEWQGFSEDELRSIKAPVLIAAGDHDFPEVEHSLAISRLIPNAQLAIVPGASHFVLSSDPDKLLSIVATFLDEPMSDVPFGTPATGYHPGVTR